MAELAHDASTCLVCRARVEAPRRLLQTVAIFLAGLCVTSGLLNLRSSHHVRTTRAVAPRAAVAAPAEPKPVVEKPQVAVVATAAQEAAAATLQKDATISFGRSFFTNGSVFETAARVAQWRPLITRAARAEGVAPAALEAIVMVESSGRSDISNGTAVGLTQLHPAVARRLGLHVDTRHTTILTRRIAHAWRLQTIRQLRRWRARYDERYAPLKELRATAASLAQAQQTL